MANSLSILEKHTDDSDDGHVYWEVCAAFLRHKGFVVEWSEHLYISDVPWDFGHFATDEGEGNKAGRQQEKYRLGAKIRTLLTSKEFEDYKRTWLDRLKKDVLAIDFEKMKSQHDDFPPTPKEVAEAKAKEKPKARFCRYCGVELGSGKPHATDCPVSKKGGPRP
jgi:hypothetical protein